MHHDLKTDPLCSIPQRYEGRKDVDHCLMVPYVTWGYLKSFLGTGQKRPVEKMMGEKPESPSTLLFFPLAHFPLSKKQNQ